MSVVGIDLGTTNTVVACVRGGRVHVLADDQGRRLLPSVVSFHPNGEVLVGQAAKERRVVDAKNTVASIKRLIGRSWRSEEIAKARPRFAFDMKEGPGHAPLVVARGEEYTLPEISAFVLRKAKAIAEAALGEPVERAVITVPANFNELQRASTKVAGRVAGLEVLRILNEPTAAALAYGLGKGGHERIAIYDFGGGTFDCTLLDLSGNVFEVLATSGDSFLGGDDLDTAIADRMAESFLLQHRYDPKQDVQAYERLRVYAEQVKVELSTQAQAKIHLREVAYGVGGAHLDMHFGLTRTELEAIAEPFIERTFRVCQDALALAGLSVGAFDKVILVGGSTRIPAVRQRVERFFGATPLDRVSADEVVGIGAAIQAAALTEVARRRSIPPPPVPGASRTTLRGINQPSPGQMRRSDPNLNDAAAAAKRITTLKGTTRLDPPAPTSSKAPDTSPSPQTFGQTSSMPGAPSSRSGRTNEDALEITRPRVDVPAGANISELADSYAHVAPTRPGADRAPPSRDAAAILASTLPIVSPRVHDPDAPTVPGDELAAALARDRDEHVEKDDIPTVMAPYNPGAPAPLGGGATAPLGGGATAPLGQTSPLGQPSPLTQTAPLAQSSPLGRTMQMPQSPALPVLPKAMPSLPIVTPFATPPAPAAPASAAPQAAPVRSPVPPAPPPPPLPTTQAKTPAPSPDATLRMQAQQTVILGPPPLPAAPAAMAPAATVAMAPFAAPVSPLATSTASPMPPPARTRSSAPPPVSLPPGPLVTPLLIDVTPRALVVETVGGYCDAIVARNSKIPCERTRAFSTVSDGQTVVRIRVGQGEGEHFGENVYLGEVELTGLRPALRGEVTVAVTFGVDANGTLQVSATDIATGRAARATLQLLGIAQDEAIAQMRQRASMQRIGATPRVS